MAPLTPVIITDRATVSFLPTDIAQSSIIAKQSFKSPLPRLADSFI
jgi:hypothetical protein